MRFAERDATRDMFVPSEDPWLVTVRARSGPLPTDAPWSGGIAFGGDRPGLAAAQRRAAALVTDFLRSVTGGLGARPRHPDPGRRL